MVKELHVSPLLTDLFWGFHFQGIKNLLCYSKTKLVIIFTLVVHCTVVYVPGKYFLFVKVETSSVRFLIQDINLGSTSDNFDLLRRSVCFIPHFLTTERIKDDNGLPLGALFSTTTVNIKGSEIVSVMKLNW